MRIPRPNESDQPEINLIPLIDVLLVIVIFLVVSTSFVRPSQLKVELPGVNAQKKSPENQQALRIRVGKDGSIGLDSRVFSNEAGLKSALSNAIQQSGQQPEQLRALIEADAGATHQSVVNVMDLLAGLGVQRVGIATATTP